MKKPKTDRTYKLFGLFIRTRRIEKELYQRDVAAMVGLSQPYYCQIEAGQRQVDLSLALRICSVLDLNMNDFLNMIRPAPRRKAEEKETHPE